MLTSFTILGIHPATLLNKDGEDAKAALAGIDFAISLSTHGMNRKDYRKQLKEIPKDQWHGLLGKSDYFCYLDSVNKAESICKLLTLRNQNGTFCSSTLPLMKIECESVELPGLRHSNPVPDELLPSSPDKQEAMNLFTRPDQASSNEDFSNFTSSLAAMAMMARQSLSEYITCASDPLVREAVLDLWPNVKKYCDAALDEIIRDPLDPRKQEVIYSAAQLMLAALKQRYAGTFDTIEEIAD